MKRTRIYLNIKQPFIAVRKNIYLFLNDIFQKAGSLNSKSALLNNPLPDFPREHFLAFNG